MSKKYVNGYDKPRFKLIAPNGAVEVIDLSFKYQALVEYYEKVSELITLLDGSKKKINRFINYEWRLFYTDYIEKDDLLKLAKIENAEIEGKRIILYPHVDNLNRFFEVFILDEKKEIGLHYHHRGNENTPNKGYEISFVNKHKIKWVDMRDPDGVVYYGSDDTGALEGHLTI